MVKFYTKYSKSKKTTKRCKLIVCKSDKSLRT
ncbi:unnamed protein product [Schistosoma margrebowiei]|uniref:Uncharacterized protein n=1 Tax=Schistosoma margrebowiei TaxID=48269 RepID=A0A3P8DQQ1_9TREM|nr:unnamed protein product [Schistosoma margrebowiei]